MDREPLTPAQWERIARRALADLEDERFWNRTLTWVSAALAVILLLGLAFR